MVERRERFLKVLYTFSPQNTHVQMKALTPSLMKPTNDREQARFREARAFLAAAVERRGFGATAVSVPIPPGGFLHSRRNTAIGSPYKENTKQEKEVCYE